LASGVAIVEGVLRAPEPDAHSRRLAWKQSDGGVRHGHAAGIDKTELELTEGTQCLLLAGHLGLGEVAPGSGRTVNVPELAAGVTYRAERRQRVEASHDAALRMLWQQGGADDLPVERDVVPYVHLPVPDVCRWLTPLSCERVKQ
jgi:hypothetical protein